jgi:dynein heavy chain, axonemal
MRTLLAYLDDAIAPGLSTITWVSLNLPTYIADLETALTRVERFLKNINDIRSARIEEEMEAIGNCKLVFLPEQPVDPSEFYNSNLAHRHKTGEFYN